MNAEVKEAETVAATVMEPEPEAQLPEIARPTTRAAKEIMALKVGEPQAIVPQTLEEVFRFAQMVVQARLAPDSYDNDPHKICIGILTGAELGIPPMQALKNIAIINKRPAIWGDLAVALCQAKGLLTKFEQRFEGDEGDDVNAAQAFKDDYTCHVTIWRKGQDSPYEGHYSVRDAKRAHLWMNAKKTPWIENPKRMLFNRARAFALRDGFADCLAGLAIVEEAQDMPAPAAAVTTDFLDDKPEATEASAAA
ncbi:MAG TPA: hypothetical protein VNZ47_11890 [Candidatus Dormibacteraeota bacterium]|jgi:hypothetical protein|nr:hypothetical protein [Candidatus Dormibacteraeota bacterium]